MKELLISGIIIACCFGCYKKEEPKDHDDNNSALNQSEAVAPVVETIVYESQLAENTDTPEEVTTLPVIEEEKDAISEEVVDNPSTPAE